MYQSIFINNTASIKGGAIAFNGKHSTSRSTFVQNSANYCGALSIVDTQDNSSIIITDSAFYYNRAVSVVDMVVEQPVLEMLQF